MTKHPWAPRGREKAEKKKEMPLVEPCFIFLSFFFFFAASDPKSKEIFVFLDEKLDYTHNRLENRKQSINFNSFVGARYFRLYGITQLKVCVSVTILQESFSQQRERGKMDRRAAAGEWHPILSSIHGGGGVSNREIKADDHRADRGID